VVGGWLPPDIMMLGKAVHRDCDSYSRNGHPLFGNWDHGARDNHGMNTNFTQDRQQSAQFAMPNQRLAPNQRYVQRKMLPDQTHDSLNQFISTIVSEVPKCHWSSQVILAVSITTRTAERTFTRKLDRQHWGAAGKDRSPGCEEFHHSEPRPSLDSVHEIPAFRVCSQLTC